MLGGMVGVKVSINKTTIEYADSENSGGDHGGESSESMVRPFPALRSSLPAYLLWLRWLLWLSAVCLASAKKRV